MVVTGLSSRTDSTWWLFTLPEQRLFKLKGKKNFFGLAGLHLFQLLLGQRIPPPLHPYRLRINHHPLLGVLPRQPGIGERALQAQLCVLELLSQKRVQSFSYGSSLVKYSPPPPPARTYLPSLPMHPPLHSLHSFLILVLLQPPLRVLPCLHFLSKTQQSLLHSWRLNTCQPNPFSQSHTTLKIEDDVVGDDELEKLNAIKDVQNQLQTICSWASNTSFTNLKAYEGRVIRLPPKFNMTSSCNAETCSHALTSVTSSQTWPWASPFPTSMQWASVTRLAVTEIAGQKKHPRAPCSHRRLHWAAGDDGGVAPGAAVCPLQAAGQNAQERTMVNTKTMRMERRRCALPDEQLEETKAGRVKSHQVESVRELRPVAAIFSGESSLIKSEWESGREERE
ncbi:hypothetical protein J5N97_027408 [Dioscorea zingiberensis]|uniref:Uncharacterized protein n=1 Tax=Dioscorea zingiberensis TaxID=325984 RepID=A0A9D5H7N5_9LILI|nr:hypothetical protein J5N97_027408 [Dioscorea zingiberensis]